MSIYKIFCEKDSFLSSQYPNDNYGRDEILDISSDSVSINRSILKFNQDEINDLVSRENINLTTSSVNLKAYLAYASNIPQDYFIEIYPLTHDWDMGTGRSGDEPNPKNGVCWNYPLNSTSSVWSGGSFNTSSLVTQSFSYLDNKDIDVNINNIVKDWNETTIPNYGILIKQTDSYESSSYFISSRYFSIDTHTIYPPHLEFRWDDSIYSSSLSIIDDSFETTIINNKGKFTEDEEYTFKVKSRDKYPTRMFQTSSLYLNTKILPETSYWAIKDHKTKEMIIDFNPFTKISADDNGNYFKVFMNGLQPERYYQILIKIVKGDDIIILEEPGNYFKINR